MRGPGQERIRSIRAAIVTKITATPTIFNLLRARSRLRRAFFAAQTSQTCSSSFVSLCESSMWKSRPQFCRIAENSVRLTSPAGEQGGGGHGHGNREQDEQHSEDNRISCRRNDRIPGFHNWLPGLCCEHDFLPLERRRCFCSLVFVRHSAARSRNPRRGRNQRPEPASMRLVSAGLSAACTRCLLMLGTVAGTDSRATFWVLVTSFVP